MQDKKVESPYEALICEGQALEKKVKRAEAAEESARLRAYAATWALADWLAENTVLPTPKQAGAMRRGAEAPGLTCSEYAKRSRYAKNCLSDYRRAAIAFPKEVRGEASVYLCNGLLREFKGDATAAIAILPERAAAAAAAGPAAGRKNFSRENRLRGAETLLDRAGVRSFADAMGRLETAKRFAVQGLRFVSEKDKWTDDEWQDLTDRVAEIDAVLAEFPVERPKRRRFAWLRAA